MPWIEWAGLDMVSEHSLFRLPTRLTKDWHQFVARYPGRNAVFPPLNRGCLQSWAMAASAWERNATSPWALLRSSPPRDFGLLHGRFVLSRLPARSGSCARTTADPNTGAASLLEARISGVDGMAQRQHGVPDRYADYCRAVCCTVAAVSETLVSLLEPGNGIWSAHPCGRVI